MAQHGFRGWDGIVLYGMVWYGMVWYGMVWYGMVWYGCGNGIWYGTHGVAWYCLVYFGKTQQKCDILLNYNTKQMLLNSSPSLIPHPRL